MIGSNGNGRHPPSGSSAAPTASPASAGEGTTVLITGGAGYIGTVLTGRLLERGYNVRILDRLYWGDGPLEAYADRIELVIADVRDIPATALDGVDGVIHLAGLSNDPTAEYDPEANWQMNAVATARARRGLRRARRRAPRVRLVVLAVRRAAPGHARRDRRHQAARRLRDLQALRRGGAARARWTTACARSSCATAPSTATARACASTSWSTRSSRTRCCRSASRCTAAAGCGARSSTSATWPTP